MEYGNILYVLPHLMVHQLQLNVFNKTLIISIFNRKSDETAEIGNGKKKFKFEQPIPVQSYLIAIAAGAIVSMKIGPRLVLLQKLVLLQIKVEALLALSFFRSHVWAEEAFIEKAAFDFADTEAMLKTAEVNLVENKSSFNFYDNEK